jgi:hypothetical protein
MQVIWCATSFKAGISRNVLACWTLGWSRSSRRRVASRSRCTRPPWTNTESFLTNTRGMGSAMIQDRCRLHQDGVEGGLAAASQPAVGDAGSKRWLELYRSRTNPATDKRAIILSGLVINDFMVKLAGQRVKRRVTYMYLTILHGWCWMYFILVFSVVVTVFMNFSTLMRTIPIIRYVVHTYKVPEVVLREIASFEGEHRTGSSTCHQDNSTKPALKELSL